MIYDKNNEEILISRGTYIVLGAAFGVVLGDLVIDNMGIGISIGIVIGIVYDRIKSDR